MDPFKVIRHTLFDIHPISYRVKRVEPNKELMNRNLFIRIIKDLQNIEVRRDLMQDEMGIDMTAYEESFFQVIENLMKLHFNKEQLGLIQTYLYTLLPDKDWDGQITLKRGSKEVDLPFRNPSDVYAVIVSLDK
jgi:hypothetical protein|tara:strand:- start:660 stop:1061 length:402 start_codon:yes stop_codon:yes gene_type:complete